MTARADAGGGISAGLLALLALVAGVSVANLYDVQPLLPLLSAHFGAGPAEVGQVGVLTQAGYAAGLLLFIPLGDAVERRRFILPLCGATAAALLGVASARSLAWLGAASLLTGLFTVAPHVALPLAARLARPEERGRVIGVVLSGLLTGILSARAVSGLLAQALGWRAVHLVAAAATTGLAVALHRRLPRDPAAAPLHYPALLASLGALLLDVGVQANQVSNLARVHALEPAARSRLNCVSMVTYFAGGAAGTFAGSRAWAAGGWPAACAAGAAFAAAGLLAWAADAAWS